MDERGRAASWHLIVGLGGKKEKMRKYRCKTCCKEFRIIVSDGEMERFS